MPRIDGILNLEKPTGMTSRTAVNTLCGLLKTSRIGHAGTLDPLASGVLVLCVGAATRLVPMIQDTAKEYVGEFLLGQSSETDDVTGELTAHPVAQIPDHAVIEAALRPFVGTIKQIPPQFSAIHVQGRRAYDFARAGEVVALEPRTVHVHALELLEYAWPRLLLRVECGSGTYIRAIGRDLGQTLGCGAVMSRLVRTRVGPYRQESAVALDDLRSDNCRQHLLPLVSLAEGHPQRVLTPDEERLIRHGRAIPLQAADPVAGRLALISSTGLLVGFGEPSPTAPLIHPRLVIPHAAER